MKTILILGAALAGAVSAPLAASAADYAPRRAVVVASYDRADPAIARGYTGDLPGCDDPAVIRSVSSAFSHREKTYWSSGLELTDFRRPREIGYRSWGWSFIPRRFCTAHSYTTDGRKRLVSYNIAEGQGFASLSWGVEWCVSGLDRSLAYAPGCKMARP